MDFTQISQMHNLISFILDKDNPNLINFEYKVNVYQYAKDKSTMKKPSDNLRFGNLVQNEFSVNIVDIDIYMDQVNLHCRAEYSKTYTSELEYNNKLNLEQKIIKALDKWISYYNN